MELTPVQPDARKWAALLVLLFAGALMTTATAELAEAKKVNRRVGAYAGTVETGGTVRFRINKKRRVVGFTASNVPQRCFTTPLVDPAVQEQPNGTVVFGAPSMALDRSSNFFYVNFPGFRPGLQPGPFREIRVQGKPKSGSTYSGKVFLHTANGNTDVPGTQVCTTGEPDWTARKLARK